MNRWRYLLVVLCGTIAWSAYGSEWTTRLQGGGEVRVDPTTNRATIVKHGVEKPLWDGVHRREDGSTLIIRSGVVVPNVEILEARDQPSESWPVRRIVGYSPCERLRTEVCGKANECANRPGCAAAGQLLEMEEHERQVSGNSNFTTYTSNQCQRAQGDREFFAICGGEQPTIASKAVGRSGSPTVSDGKASPCQVLVDKVCGQGAQCAEKPACGPARQLLEREADEYRRRELRPNGTAPTAGDCRQAVKDEEFFAPCPPQ